MAKAKQQLEKINVHSDFVLWGMVSIARHAISNICSFMQEFTEYGDEYMAAYNQHTKLTKELDKYEHLLAQCMKHKKGGKKEDGDSNS